MFRKKFQKSFFEDKINLNPIIFYLALILYLFHVQIFKASILINNFGFIPVENKNYFFF